MAIYNPLMDRSAQKTEPLDCAPHISISEKPSLKALFYLVSGAAVSLASLVLFLSPVMVFDDGRKQNSVGQFSAILGILLSMAGSRQPASNPVLFRVGLYVGILSLIFHTLIPFV